MMTATLIGTLWVNNKTGNVVRVTTNPSGAHRYVTVQGARTYQVSADNLPKKYQQIDAEWIAHAPAGTAVPDVHGVVWVRDDVGQWYTDGVESGRYSHDLALWATQS